MGLPSVLIINGSASSNSSNERLIANLVALSKAEFDCEIFDHLKDLPHFDPELSVENTPESISEIRTRLGRADAVIICTPEYVFSIPSGLKNLIEWCVSTTLFSDKPCGLITASAQGLKGHEELQLLMKTLMANFNKNTTLLIQGIKGKISQQGEITDPLTQKAVEDFVRALKDLISIKKERAGI